MKSFLSALVCAAVLAAPSFAQPLNGPVIITEIMYNPSNPEPASEYVEIYNTGGVAIDISGWALADEDGMTGVFPTPTLINPAEAVVIIPDLILATDFQAAWGSTFQVIAVSGWSSGGLNGLANSPSNTNEVLTLVDNMGFVQDEVNFDDNGATWPSDPGDRSIFVSAAALDAISNDNGTNWSNSTAGAAGAFMSTVTAVFPNVDLGSPGVVDTGFLPFDHDVTCTPSVAIPGLVDLNIVFTGGTIGNTYYLATAFQNVGVAPNGWFFGIDITYQEIITQITDPLIFTGVISGATTVNTIPGIASSCPLGVSFDSVALEWDSATGLLVQTSTAKTIRL